MPIYNIPRVTIDLENYPPTGNAGLSMRVRPIDRDLINKAAAYIGLRQADFIRMAVVNSAREVVKEIGTREAHEHEWEETHN